jgi:hypothetical protein
VKLLRGGGVLLSDGCLHHVGKIATASPARSTRRGLGYPVRSLWVPPLTGVADSASENANLRIERFDKRFAPGDRPAVEPPSP